VAEPKDADDDRDDFPDSYDERCNMLFEFLNYVIDEHLDEEVHARDAYNVIHDGWMFPNKLGDVPELQCYQTKAQREEEDPLVDLEHEIDWSGLEH
jgi:hypothetical protein